MSKKIVQKKNWTKEAKANAFALFSPAKLNLFFRVLSKRSDGFHEIASLMQAISLGDTLYFEQSSQDELTSTEPSLPTDDTNLVTQALQLFREKTGEYIPIKIHIEKNIPMQAGLGGGSSNLATTLWALNEIHETQVSKATLINWAGELSSDAPFFFSSGTAYATGRGEKIKDLPALKSQSLWLALPEIGMSTPLVYKHCKPTLEALPENIHGYYRNDLETAAFALEPTLKKLKEDLLALGFETVSMTGSGSAFFCFGNVHEPALEGITFTEVTFLNNDQTNWYRNI